VLWSTALPQGHDFCTMGSIDTSPSSNENDDLMRSLLGRRLRHCLPAYRPCASASRCSSLVPVPILAKAMLYAINGGRMRRAVPVAHGLSRLAMMLDFDT
jgi:hypothetical protein